MQEEPRETVAHYRGSMLMNIRITMDQSVVALDDLARLYTESDFGFYEDLVKDSAVIKIFGGGATGFFAIDMDSGKLLGAARVLSDNIITSYIAEICVLPMYRGTGLAEKLLEAVTTRFNHTAIFTCGFVGMERFLKTQGLSEKPKLFACSRRPHFKRLHEFPLN